MKNKELQELFAAKRTTEANSRRQAELRQKLEAAAAPAAPAKTRRLWPVWAGAAAASIALLIATLPLLITNSQPTSIPIAQANVPEVQKEEVVEETLTATPARPASAVAVAVSRHKATTAGEPTLDLAATEEEAEPLFETGEEPFIEAPALDLADNTTPQPQPSTAPRIHHRTSTRMVSGNSSETPAKETLTVGEALAQVLSSGNSSPLILKKIELS